MTTCPTVPRPRAAMWGCALVAALGAPVASGQTRNEDISSASIDELKRFYLACDRASMRGRLAGTEVMHCSLVYEELKRRAFGGDFERFLAWSRGNPSVRISGQ